MKKRILLVMLALVAFLFQGCMSVSVRVNERLTNCTRDISYAGADGFLYDPAARMLMVDKNSMLDNTMKQYPDSYKVFLESRESFQNAELKSLISGLTQLTGAAVAIISICNWRQPYWVEYTMAGLGIGAVGIVINLMAIPEMFDSCRKLGEAIDRYNAHCR